VRQVTVSRGRTAATVHGRPVERRQLTVIFCDLIGSTAFFEELDPEEVGELMRSFRLCCASQIEAAGGFVAQFQGDGVIGYFGYTDASESNAERAVRAGLDIVTLVPRLPAPGGMPLQTRVGIATGLAIVGDPHGDGTRLEQSAVGQTLHLAARLQSAASPNQVVIAHNTRRLTGDLFICRGAEKLVLKGFSDPVQAWRVLGLRPSVTQFRTRWHPLLTPIVNRKPEIEALSLAWHRASAGQGQIVTLIGNAGIGKSRLVSELRRQLGPAKHLWLEAGGAQFFQNTPFYPIAQVIRRVFDPTGRRPPADVLTRLETSIRDAGIHAPEAVPLVIEMLGLGTSEPLSVPPEERRARLFSTLAGWILGMARLRPLVIVVEDLHWADPSTRELIEFMVPRIKTVPVLMLLSARPDFRPPWPDRDHSSRLYLNRLTDDHLQQIVTAVRGAMRPAAKDPAAGASGVPAGDDIAAIVQRAEGVPLFGIELTRLIEEPKARTSDREIPATLAALLAARLDQLGVAAKSVARAAAVFGDEIPLQVLEAVVDMPMSRLRPLLATLRRKAVLQEEGANANPVYRFTHSLLRDSAYDALPRAERRVLHRRVATAIEARFDGIAQSRPGLLAHQWTEAGDLARGAAAWQKAGDLFTLSRAFMEAERAYQNATDALAGLSESMERDIQELALRSMLADVLQITRGYSAPSTVETFDRIRVLAERTGDRDKRCQHILGAWAAASSAGDYKRASVLADQFYQLAIDDPARPGHAHMVQITARYRIGDLRRAEDHFLQGQAHFASPSFERHRGWIAQTYGNSAYVAWILGDDDAARRRIEHALLIARRNESVYDLAFAQFMAATHEVLVNDPARATELSNDSIRLSDEFGFPQFATIARITLGRAKAGLGSAAEGVTLIRKGLAGMAGTSSRNWVTVYMTWLAEAYALAGLLDEALDAAREALCINPQELFFRPESFRLRGEILLRDGKPGEAERDFLDALVLAKKMGAWRFYDRATCSLQQLLRSRGDMQD
jgi:class 3 adenylate cyclase/tetratricopeptide (TPR) repeat protein